MNLLSLLDPFTEKKWQTSLPYKILQLIIMKFQPFIYLKPKEGTPFGRSLPVKAIIGSSPPGP